MTIGPYPTRPRPRTEAALNFMRLFSGVLFLVILLVWLLLTGLVHDFATIHPDASHTFAVHEHGTFYLKPALGRLYVCLPWVWVSSAALTLFLNWLNSKRPWRWM